LARDESTYLTVIASAKAKAGGTNTHGMRLAGGTDREDGVRPVFCAETVVVPREVGDR